MLSAIFGPPIKRFMPKKGPIILVEDDKDDQELIAEIIQQSAYENELRIFNNGKEALDYLLSNSDRHFLILCDVNLPKMNGMELKTRINENDTLREKSIPFIFLSTTENPTFVKKAFGMSVQGFFNKPNNFNDLKIIVEMALNYWKLCEYPGE